MICRNFGVKVTKKVKLYTSLDYLLRRFFNNEGFFLLAQNRSIFIVCSDSNSKKIVTCFFPIKE
ncbi:hypothetical protein CHRYSEO8AT_450023 [Chryseobacterium sp. 8AT]|nr:hypothetical protein CHRYSEO8AT_450023 [Chryseobacterium sp. 8AT]